MYIFLDIDGVLNTKTSWRIPYQLNEFCFKALAQLCYELDGKLILTSTWRYGYDPAGKQNTPQMTKFLKLCKQYNIRFLGVTPKGSNRNQEIEDIIRKHDISNDNYLIIDDDNTLFIPTTKHIYYVNADTGLTTKDVKTIILKYKKGLL